MSAIHTEKVKQPLRQKLGKRQLKIHKASMAALVLGFSERKNFYAYTLSLLEQIPDKSVDTMAVSVQGGRYVLRYHPEWYQYLVIPEVEGVIEHECLHIVLEHIPRFARYIELWTDEIEKIKRMMVANAAADLEVNSTIIQNKKNRLPEGALLPRDFRLPELKPVEFYIEELVRDVEVTVVPMPQPGDSDGDGKQSGGGNGNPTSGSDDREAGTKSGKKARGPGASSAPSQASAGDQSPDDSDDQSDGASDQEGAEGDDSESGQDPQAGSETATGGNQESQIQVTSDNKKLEQAMQEQHDWEIRPGEGESVRDVIESLEQHGQELVDQAYEHFTKLDPHKGRGLIPGFIEEMVQARRTPMKRQWDQLLKSMILDTRQRAYEHRLNQIKPSRLAMGSSLGLYGHDRDILKFSILIGVDVSGSMSNEIIALGLSIPQEIVDGDMDVEVKVVEYDTQIHRRYYLKRHQKPDPHVEGRGGTDFNCFFKEARDGKSPDGKVFKPDLILNYTDGGAPMPHEDVRVSTKKLPLLWVLSPDGQPMWGYDNDPFGRIIKMDWPK